MWLLSLGYLCFSFTQFHKVLTVKDLGTRLNSDIRKHGIAGRIVVIVEAKRLVPLEKCCPSKQNCDSRFDGEDGLWLQRIAHKECIKITLIKLDFVT